ncbi:MAG: protein translocase subunit SecD [Rhizobiales bacterium]|nr:protein translocase subunit SecD [Hyphomicrobiales bacterium]
MLHFSRWKIIAIIASIVLAAIYALPNALPPAQQAWLAPIGARPMTLGLDLQGGANVLMEIDRKDLKEQLTLQLSGDVRAALREIKVGYQAVARTAEGVNVRITKPEDAEKAETKLKELLQPLDAGIFSTGAPVNLFDLARQDQQFAFAFSQQGLDARVARAITQSLRIVENRVNSLGTSEATIQQQGKDRILIQLPGIQDPERVKDLLGRTAKLTFQLLCESQPTGAANENPPPDCAALPVKEEVDKFIAARKARNEGDAPLAQAQLDALPNKMWVQTSSRATVDGADLNDAQPGFGQSNDPVVTFRFNQKGALRFGKLTAENVGRPFAIILDNVIVSAPNINEPILGGSGQISGNFTTEETNELAIVLRSGALPAKLTIVEERTVGPSLGSDSIRAGVIASIAGLIGIMCFIMLPYGLFGIFANIALLANLLMLVAVMSAFGFTLTLPGIAGIVLTLGMAIDSNVLVYERIREEWRRGRTPFNSVEIGFKEALTTVFDANLTTLIAAAVLFGVGSGPIRGFAVTLAIGIFTTMFTAFTLTRLISALWVLRSRPKEIPL